MLSVIIPAYNEGEHVRENLIKIAAVLEGAGIDFELVPVNDGSPDNTGDEIAKAAEGDPRIRPVSYEKNRGKGGAIKEGIAHAEGEVIGFIDADLDISPDHLPTYWNAMNEQHADVVIGSKMHKDSKLDYPPARKLFSLGYFVLLKILFGLKLKDTQTGIKLYKADLIKGIVPKLKVKGYAFDIEILALAAQQKAVIIEMPVEVNYTRAESFSRIRVSDIVKMFTDTIAIWWNIKVVKKYNQK